MKLIIQIPCFNEENALPATLQALPRQVEGFNTVEWLVIDDGSTDRTVEVAQAHGVHHIVKVYGNRGLAYAFMAGIAACVRQGADVIVNTDADNQYNANDIPALVRPILEDQADIVIGSRPIMAIQHFSLLKRILQRIGSSMVRLFSHTAVEDAPSGFRAITRDAALRMNVFNAYTYTLETIIQAGQSNLRIACVPIRVNGPTRPSRLVKNMWSYIRRSIGTMISAYLTYKPVKLFGCLALIFFVPGLLLAVRYLYMMITGSGLGHVQSVIAAAVLAICSVFMAAMGVIAQLQKINRYLLEEMLYLQRTQAKVQMRGKTLADLRPMSKKKMDEEAELAGAGRQTGE